MADIKRRGPVQDTDIVLHEKVGRGDRAEGQEHAPGCKAS